MSIERVLIIKVDVSYYYNLFSEYINISVRINVCIKNFKKLRINHKFDKMTMKILKNNKYNVLSNYNVNF